MKKIITVAVLLVLCAYSRLQGQTNKPIQPLNIGDTLPGITLTNLYNYPAKTARLSDFKGKLLILDFWASWCGACIEAFPKLQALQQKYNNEIQVVLVNSAATGDDEATIRASLARLEKRTGMAIRLPLVTGDSLLTPYFPYRYLPQEVWVDKQGIVRAVTTAAEVTDANISAMLRGDASGLHQKEDIANFNPKQPLFLNNNGKLPAGTRMWRSTLTGYIEGLGNATGKNSNEAGVTRFYMFNRPLFQLYAIAFKEAMQQPLNRIIFNLTNPALFAMDTVRYGNRFCYEIISPPTSMDSLRAHMRQDLERTFHITASVIKKETEVLVLDTAARVTAYTRQGAPEWQMEAADLHKHLTNQPVAGLVHFLNRLSPTPVIDESGVSQNIDMVFPGNLYAMDMNAIAGVLESYGFTLTRKKRTIYVTIISDKQKQLP